MNVLVADTNAIISGEPSKSTRAAGTVALSGMGVGGTRRAS